MQIAVCDDVFFFGGEMILLLWWLVDAIIGWSPFGRRQETYVPPSVSNEEIRAAIAKIDLALANLNDRDESIALREMRFDQAQETYRLAFINGGFDHDVARGMAFAVVDKHRRFMDDARFHAIILSDQFLEKRAQLEAMLQK